MNKLILHQLFLSVVSVGLKQAGLNIAFEGLTKTHSRGFCLFPTLKSMQVVLYLMTNYQPVKENVFSLNLVTINEEFISFSDTISF